MKQNARKKAKKAKKAKEEELKNKKRWWNLFKN